MASRLRPLTRDQHTSVAELVNSVQDRLGRLSDIVGPAEGTSYVDDTLRVRRTVQDHLIDPLRNAWDADFGPLDNPYQAVGYHAK